MTGNVENQKTWINAKIDLARPLTNEETKRREKEILDRIIPTELVDVDKVFDKTFDEEDIDNLSKCQPCDHAKDQEDNFASDCRVYSLSHFLNKRNQMNSFMKTWKKRTFNHQNLLNLPIEITGGKTKKPSRMSIHYHLYPNPSISSKELNISLNRMCVGNITINA
jgi:superfamily II DNA helicase RecQ